MVDLHKLKLDRIDKGFTQADMGACIGKSLSSYNKKEAGLVDFADDEKIAVAKKLGYTDEDFKAVFFAQ